MSTNEIKDADFAKRAEAESLSRRRKAVMMLFASFQEAGVTAAQHTNTSL